MLLRLGRSNRSRRTIGTVGTLSFGDWALLGVATMLLPAVALALRMTTLGRLLGVIESVTALRHRSAEPADAARIARLVEAAARCCRPKPTCLVKALVAFTLLKGRGLAAEFSIGVRKAGGRLDAHAWVGHGGAIVMGGGVPSVYMPLLHVVGEGCLASGGRGEDAR